jgi:cell wall-associated NlpC family hydrolase
MTTTRRTFLGQLALIAAGTALGGSTLESFAGMKTDGQIFRATMAWAKKNGIARLPIGEAMAAFGQHFIGTPYVAHSLEEPGDEHLVVNLRGFDCLTFVENMLAMARCVRSGKTTFDDFSRQLTHIRYTGGTIDGYPSRLHYFTDWMRDNGNKGVVRPLTQELGGEGYTKTIDFMTTHTGSYQQLADTAFVQRMKVVESSLSAGPLHYIAADKIAEIEAKLQSGDVVGTVTTMAGMDIAHTGMVLRRGGKVHFMHAPLSGKKVLVSDGTLAEYIHGIRSHTGIIIGRPLEPVR